MVGAASVPQGADEEHTRAGGHHHTDPEILAGGTTIGYPLVTPGQHYGGTVVVGEGIDSPDGGGTQWWSRPGDGVHAVVVVQQLGLLTGVDVDDLELGEQVVGQEQPVEQCQYSWVLDQRVADAGLGENVVEPLGA